MLNVEQWWGQIPGTYPVLLSEEDGLANGEFCLACASEKKIKSFIWDQYSHRTGSAVRCYITTLTTTCYVIKRARLVHSCWSSTCSKAGFGDGDGDGGDGSNSLTPLQIIGLRQAPLEETIKTMLHNASLTNQAFSCDTEKKQNKKNKKTFCILPTWCNDVWEAAPVDIGWG